MSVDMLMRRLENYPGAHTGESWKLETDLNKCTNTEKQKMHQMGLSVELLEALGLNRGEVAHILYGYLQHTKKKR